MFISVRIGFAAFILLAAMGMSGFGITPASAADAGKREDGSAFSEHAVRVHGDRISIDVQNAAIRDVLREIGQQAGVAIVPDDSISGEITIQMTDVTVEKALENLCRSRALVYEYLPEVKAYRIIGALALNRAAEQGGTATAAPALSPGNGVGVKPVWVGASADGVDGQQDGGIDGKRANGISPVEARGAAGDKAEDPAKPRYKAGELLVEFKPGVAAEQVEELHRSLGSTVLGNIPRLQLQRIRLRDGLAEQEAMALYETSGIVEIVERHALQYPNRTTNDPYIDRQWGLATIHAGKAWEITVGKPEVVIAVIDTGVDYSHPDLQGNIWTNTSELNGITGVDDDGNGYVDDIRGWDFAGADENNTVADNDPMDADGHGTHVAGIIAATGNNGLGVAGVNWQAKIMPLKVEADNGESFSTYGVFEAILYAIDQGAKIVNCSFGGTGSVLELKIFDLLKTAGILAVCSAGNSGADNDVTPHYPSDYPLDNIISVAASDANDRLASFSNYGATSVDLMAPGAGIYSTIPEHYPTEALVRTAGTDPIEYPAFELTYAGRTDENGITGTAYPCGKGNATEFPPEVSGNIALIERGLITFLEKVQNAQAAGAKGVIIYNNSVGSFSGTLGSAGDWLPAISITKADGEALAALGTPVVTLINKLSSVPVFYGYMDGTSMAAPQVAGVAGLLLARRPSLSYGELRSAILDTVDKVEAAAGKTVTGGRLNALAALRSILLPGDLTRDDRIGMDDAILALQLLAGLPPPDAYPCPACGKDVNGDDRIGMEEALFILQSAAGLR